MNWIEELDDILATVENTVKGEEGDLITKARGIINEHRATIGQGEITERCDVCGRTPNVIVRTHKGTFCQKHVEL